MIGGIMIVVGCLFGMFFIMGFFGMCLGGGGFIFGIGFGCFFGL